MKNRSLFSFLAILFVSFQGFAAAGRPETNTVRLSRFLQDELTLRASRGDTEFRIPVIMKLQPGVELSAEMARRVRPLPLVNGLAARLSTREIEELRAAGAVQYATLDAAIRPTFENITAVSRSEQNPFLAAMGVDRLQRDGFRGQGVVVALFDSGIGYHPDIPDIIIAKVLKHDHVL